MRRLQHECNMNEEAPDWVKQEQANEQPDSTEVFQGMPATGVKAQQQIYVQAGGPMMMAPQTNAVAALVLSILGVVICSVCTAVPGLILANGALQITRQHPGHPDEGLAKAAQIVAWIAIGIFGLVMLFWGGSAILGLLLVGASL